MLHIKQPAWWWKRTLSTFLRNGITWNDTVFWTLMTKFGQLKFNFLASTFNGHSSQLKNHVLKVPILVVFVTTTISVIIGFWKWCCLWRCCKCHNAPLSKAIIFSSCLDCQFMSHFIRIAHILICHRRHSALAEASCNHHLFFEKNCQQQLVSCGSFSCQLTVTPGIENPCRLLYTQKF